MLKPITLYAQERGMPVTAFLYGDTLVVTSRYTPEVVELNYVHKVRLVRAVDTRKEYTRMAMAMLTVHPNCSLGNLCPVAASLPFSGGRMAVDSYEDEPYGLKPPITSAPFAFRSPSRLASCA